MTSHIMCLQFSICKVKLLKRDSLIIIKLCLCQLPRSRDKCVKTCVANIAFFPPKIQNPPPPPLTNFQKIVTMLYTIVPKKHMIQERSINGKSTLSLFLSLSPAQRFHHQLIKLERWVTGSPPLQQRGAHVRAEETVETISISDPAAIWVEEMFS